MTDWRVASNTYGGKKACSTKMQRCEVSRTSGLYETGGRGIHRENDLLGGTHLHPSSLQIVA